MIVIDYIIAEVMSWRRELQRDVFIADMEVGIHGGGSTKPLLLWQRLNGAWKQDKGQTWGPHMLDPMFLSLNDYEVLAGGVKFGASTI